MTYETHIILAAFGSWLLIMSLVVVAGLTLHNAFKEAEKNVRTFK